MAKSNVDSEEVFKFAQHASDWWDTDGPLKTLHDINPARLQFIQNACDLRNKSVLDLGCGGGILSEAMAAEGARVTGLDAESAVLQVASEHAERKKLNIEYVHSLIEDYDSPPFDVITCMEMLEHVPDPQLIINHCRRLLKPGGYLFLSTINRTLKAYLSVVIAAEYVLNLLPKQTHDFQKFIKPSELATMARSTQFEFLNLQGMSYNPFTRVAELQDSVDINYLISFKARY